MSPLPLQLVHVDPTIQPNDGDVPVYSGVSGLYVPTPGGAGGGTVTTTGAPSSGNLTKFSGGTSITNGDLSGYVTTSGTLVTSLAPNYLQYRDEQTQNTAGGTFTSGAWRTRVLNTEVSDAGGFGTLSGNQITLAAGTYHIAASAPAYFCEQNQLRLQNVTDAATVLIGQVAYASRGGGDGSEVSASLVGQFTIAASKALELQHQCTTTNATNGFGVACNFTTEVYAVVELWKVG